MKSSIVKGTLSHTRFEPVVHSFKYKHTMLLVNLDDFKTKLKIPKLLKYNHWGLLSIRDSKYIDDSSKPINSKIHELFSDSLQDTEFTQCMLLTTPAVFGYSFNPVSFYFLINNFDQIIGCASEVHNTFGESHLYLLNPVKTDISNKAVFTHEKQLYVSPFIERSGQYSFELDISNDSISIKIKLTQNDKNVFTSQFSGITSPFTSVNLCKSIFRIFATVTMTEIRILAQAYTLFARKHLAFIRKPKPNPLTINAPSPGFIKKIARLINFFYGKKG